MCFTSECVQLNVNNMYNTDIEKLFGFLEVPVEDELQDKSDHELAYLHTDELVDS